MTIRRPRYYLVVIFLATLVAPQTQAASRQIPIVTVENIVPLRNRISPLKFMKKEDAAHFSEEELPRVASSLGDLAFFAMKNNSRQDILLLTETVANLMTIRMLGVLNDQFVLGLIAIAESPATLEEGNRQQKLEEKIEIQVSIIKAQIKAGYPLMTATTEARERELHSLQMIQKALLTATTEEQISAAAKSMRAALDESKVFIQQDNHDVIREYLDLFKAAFHSKLGQDGGVIIAWEDFYQALRQKHYTTALFGTALKIENARLESEWGTTDPKIIDCALLMSARSKMH